VALVVICGVTCPILSVATCILVYARILQRVESFLIACIVMDVLAMLCFVVMCSISLSSPSALVKVLRECSNNQRSARQGSSVAKA
jgi:membrane-anchored glycerophosphoryl diester phosphodiesterase (GDPDase)